MKNVIRIGTTIISLFAIFNLTCSAATTTSEAQIPSVNNVILEPIERELVDTENLDELVKLIDKAKENMGLAHQMAQSCRNLGYPEYYSVIKLAKLEWEQANQAYTHYSSIYNKLIQEQEEQRKAAEEARWAQKMNEHPTSTTVWRYLTETLGYNEYVAAGILGNMIRECGGATLDLQWWVIGGKSYYGICQWYRGYSNVWGKDLNGQLDYLASTIKYQIDTFGYAYRKGFNYDQFLQIKDVSQAALAFSKTYERGASYTHSYGQKYAMMAWNYFMS